MCKFEYIYKDTCNNNVHNNAIAALTFKYGNQNFESILLDIKYPKKQQAVQFLKNVSMRLV